MNGNDGKPLNCAAVLAAVAVYNNSSRGSAEFGAIPRALVTILDGLTPGKTTYVKGIDRQVQLTCGKDKKIVGQ
ncbi:MAG TPA: hypothetical protein HPQ04_03135 [Rhodospirillaceae bacterium]|nr:hypothetical protein [Rhodospirillaceae bacterium]